MSLPEGIEAAWPLSPVQAGMLFHLLDGTALPGTYVGILTLRLVGPMDPARFETALTDAIRGRDAMRAAFLHDGLETPVQVVHREIALPWTHLDWSGRDDAETALEALVADERDRGLDIAQPPLMRLTLVRMAPDRHVLVWTCHHLVSDGWSTAVLVDEALARYAGEAVAPGAARFRDHLAWLKRRDGAADRDFWTRYLDGFLDPVPVDLPGDTTRGPHGRATLTLPTQAAKGLETLARTARATRATVLMAAWGLLLHRLSRQADILFGLTSSGRSAEIPGIDRAVGAFLNTLPVRMRIDPDQSVAAFLAGAEADALSRRRHEFAALSDVQRWGPLPGGTPLFEALFVMESFPAFRDRPGAPGVAEVIGRDASNYPLALLVTPGETLRLDLVHDPARVGHRAARALLSAYATLLEGMAADPARRLGDIPLAPAPADPPVPAEPFRPVHRAILDAAKAGGDAPAISFDGQSLTGRDLASGVHGLAARLAADGIGGGDLVAIALPRGAEAVVAMLAVQAAGAAYLPLDIDYPAPRLAAMLETARPRAVIGRAGRTGNLPEGLSLTDPDGAGGAPDRPDPGPDDLAYVMFTSGSQGRPKGVAVTHAGLHWSTAARTPFYGERPDCFLLLSSLAFDSSVAGLFWTLSEGGHLVVSPPRIEQDPIALGRLIARHGVTHMLCLPGLWRALLDAVPARDLASLRCVIVAGEAVPGALVARHAAVLPGVRLVNEYGPTEGTVWCAAADITRADPDAPVPIGEAVPGAVLRLLDACGHPVPDGLPGEIHVGGPGVARGYLGDPAASAAAFRADPFAPGGRLYRTGDMAVRSARGLLFLGRRDGQVKIRGQRIELAEVEAAAMALVPGAEAVAVVAETDGRARLGLFLSGAAVPATLRDDLAGRLPAAMVPSRVEALDALPRLPNGKTDRAALVDRLSRTGTRQTAADAPRGEVETALARIWAEVLGVDAVGPQDDFFALGGDSLLSIRVAARAGRAGLRLAPHDLFRYPTPAALAEALAARAARGAPPPADMRFATANESGRQTPVLLIHGSWQMFATLANVLGPDRPLGHVLSHHLSGRLPPFMTIDALTREAEARLRSLRPRGPYVICGYSMGGVIAADLARRLRDAGETVELLFLLDPTARRSTGRLHPFWLLRDAGVIAVTTVLGRLGYWAADRARGHYVRRVYHAALTRHRPGRIAVPALVLTTLEESMLPGHHPWWRDALDGARIETVREDHLALQSDPAALLAWTARLSVALSALQDPSERP